MGDLMKDVADSQSKIVGLAKTMPETRLRVEAGAGVRSTGDVLMHVAADNYFMPAAMGIAPPAATGINGKEYKSAVAFETRKMSRDQIIAELEQSFAFLQTSMAAASDACSTPRSRRSARKRPDGRCGCRRPHTCTSTSGS